ncbi:MAG: VWA domain-containing protein, partial [Myxococcota bacterium]
MMNVTTTFSRPLVAASAESRIDLLIDFQSAQEKPPRRPLNLSLVLDHSGSMAGKSLKQALRASSMLVDRLTPEDTLSVVIYDDTIKTIWAPRAVDDKAAIKKALNAVRAGGLTNLSGGWEEGCTHVSNMLMKGGVNRVLLLTDGQANRGITDQAKLVELARAQGSKGVATTTLGFGSYFNEDLLIAMADAAGGNFYFIQSPTDAAEVFNIEVEGLSAVAAQKLQVGLKPAPGVEIVSVLNAFPTRRDGQGIGVGVEGIAIERLPGGGHLGHRS